MFVPKGTFKLTGELALRPNTHMFGLTQTLSSLGSVPARGRGPGGQRASAFTIVTADAPDAAPGLSHLGVHGNLHWRSGQGTNMLAAGFPTTISGHGGGRFYGVTSMGRQRVIEGLENPLSLYALNVERITTNPQSLFRNCRHLRIYYFKVEAGTLNRGGDANTPVAISRCQDVRIYCLTGNVRDLGDRPMLEIADSQNILVSQLKAFRPGSFPHISETHGGVTDLIPSNQPCALFQRSAPAHD